MFRRTFDVLAIGTATRDVFIRTTEMRTVRDPEHLRRIGFRTGSAQCLPAGSKIEVEAPDITVGGGAANAATTFARQGLRAAAVLKIGRDDSGESVLRSLHREGVRCIPVYDRKEQTASSVVLLEGDGERIILHHRGASRDLSDKEVPYGHLRARWAYITPGHIPFPVMSRIVAHLKRNGAKIAMNPSEYYVKLGPKKLKGLLRRIDVIILNREEACDLTGMNYDDEKGIFRRFDELVPGLAVMTEGAKGVLVSDGKKTYRAGIFSNKKVVNRLGAGDAFGSGFVSALARAKDFSPAVVRDAIRTGSANAASVVEHIGASAGILTRRELSSPRWRRLAIREADL